MFEIMILLWTRMIRVMKEALNMQQLGVVEEVYTKNFKI